VGHSPQTARCGKQSNRTVSRGTGIGYGKGIIRLQGEPDTQEYRKPGPGGFRAAGLTAHRDGHPAWRASKSSQIWARRL